MCWLQWFVTAGAQCYLGQTGKGITRALPYLFQVKSSLAGPISQEWCKVPVWPLQNYSILEEVCVGRLFIQSVLVADW